MFNFPWRKFKNASTFFGFEIIKQVTVIVKRVLLPMERRGEIPRQISHEN